MTAQITIAIPTLNRTDLLEQAVGSVRQQSIENVELIVIDNGGSAKLGRSSAKTDTRTSVLRPGRNLLYAAAANAGLRRAATQFVAVLNDDAVLDKNWAAAALEAFQVDQTIGAVASKIMKVGDLETIDSVGDSLNIAGQATNRGWGEIDIGQYEKREDVFSAAGACAVYRRSAFEEAGGFDEHFGAYVEDVDLGFRLQLLGYRCLYEPAARVWHHGGATPKPRQYALRLTERNMLRNLIKNMPTALLKDNARALLSAQARPAPVLGGASWLAWASGKTSVASEIPRLLNQRCGIQRCRRVSDEHLLTLLSRAPIVHCHL
jgi:GT2 family glycosyltransferase